VNDPGPQNALSFNAIRQSFPGQAGEAPLSVLNDISFNVPRGKFVSVIGPSGCGKSTLIQRTGTSQRRSGCGRQSDDRVRPAASAVVALEDDDRKRRISIVVARRRTGRTASQGAGSD
jgi:ABC-type nitrate/sulfonate/bicarbonate transport system ATPase subunit